MRLSQLHITNFTATVVFVFGLVLLPQVAESKESSPKQLRVKQLSLDETSEVALDLTAQSTGASWAKKDAEAAAVTIEVDGVYNQDLLLFAGSNSFNYHVMLGTLSAGKHQIVAKLNLERSAPKARHAVIQSLEPVVIRQKDVSAEDWFAIENSPVLYQRPNSIDRFSDIPILMYYEVFHPSDDELLVRYTTMFTNEDGGTPSVALMARWGRASDIEWVYEFKIRKGEIVEQHYQAVSHETKAFKGERLSGKHPALGVASDNNNFSDTLKSPVRFALTPARLDLTRSTRESIMDQNPWSYRIVAEELRREGKISTIRSDSNTIADPREYLYVDLHAEQNGSALNVEVVGSKITLKSDVGEPKLRIDRSGNARTAIRLDSKLKRIDSIGVHCFSSIGASCENVYVMRVSTLNYDFKPIVLSDEPTVRKSLKPDQSLTLSIHAEKSGIR